MEKEFLRKEIRKIIKEISYYSNSNSFPYENPHEMPHLPQDIKPEKQYVWDFVELSTNQDMYEFPENEFKLGMSIEKQKNNAFNVLDIAELVIKNMKQDSKFYSKLMK